MRVSRNRQDFESGAHGNALETAAAEAVSSPIETGVRPVDVQETRPVIEYRLIGADIQFVAIDLPPGQEMIAEAGAMTSMDENIKFSSILGDNPESSVVGKVFSAGKRLLAKESFLLTRFQNISDSRSQEVVFAAPYPGQIIPVDLSRCEGVLYCQKGAFLCATRKTRINVTVTKRIAAGLWGGEGFILTKIEGDGIVFVHAGGTIIKKEIDREKLRVETGSIVCFTQGLDYSVEPITNIKSLLFGGEGCFLTTFKGRGTVYLQSLPFKTLCRRIFQNAPEEFSRAARG